jgi:hypothetical protein
VLGAIVGLIAYELGPHQRAIWGEYGILELQERQVDGPERGSNVQGYDLWKWMVLIVESEAQ